MPASVTSAEIYEEIMARIDQLPNSYRRVFRLSVLEEMSHRQIAELLNINPHTSSAQLFRAKELLRRSLVILLLGLLAIGVPIGLWFLLSQKNGPKQTTNGNYSWMKKVLIMLYSTEMLGIKL